MVDLDFREHTREHFQPQVWLIPQAVGPALDDPYLIVESFHESQRHLILRLAMGHNPIPVPVYHVGELLIRCQTLPLQGGPPVLEEFAGPGGMCVIPQLSEGFLEYIGRVESPVGRQQKPETSAAIGLEMLTVCQQSIFLSFDESALWASQTGVFAFAHLIQGLAELPQYIGTYRTVWSPVGQNAAWNGGKASTGPSPPGESSDISWKPDR